MSDNVASLYAPRAQFAQLLGVSDDTLRRWIRTARANGTFRVPSHTVRRTELFHVHAFTAWFDHLVGKGMPVSFPRRSA